MITTEKLIRAGIGPTQAKAWVGPLAAAAEQCGFTTPLREAMLVAQAGHESQGFTQLEEGLYYSSPERIDQMFGAVSSPAEAVALGLVKNPEKLANYVYALRNGNGSVQSGDGWRYRGRGLIQLTGRDNYKAAAFGLAHPYESQPELVAQPSHAALTACWWLVDRRALTLIDAGMVDSVTRLINGKAMAGAQDRRDRYAQALAAFREQ